MLRLIRCFGFQVISPRNHLAPILMAITDQIANDRREEGCFANSPERTYYHVGNSFIKRSLRPSEWLVGPFRGTIRVPRQNSERLRNEAASLQYVQQHTNIPVPKLHCCFENDQAVPRVGVRGRRRHGWTKRHAAQRKNVQRALESHLGTLHSSRSAVLGGPRGIVLPPYRTTERAFRNMWNLRHSDHDEHVFCHNNLLQQNVIVDSQLLKINIIDGEYAGFFPVEFEMSFFERIGPSKALDGEDDDSARLVEFLESRSV